MPGSQASAACGTILWLQVRGAPAIGIAALLSLAVELSRKNVFTLKELEEWTTQNLDYLMTSRPTGVNLKIECSALKGSNFFRSFQVDYIFRNIVCIRMYQKRCIL